MPNDLTKAEQAAAEALAAVGNADYVWAGPGHFDASDWENEARAVVAAVRPEIYDEIATKLDEVGFLSGERAWPFVQLMREMANGRRTALRAAERQAEGDGAS